MPEKQPDPTPKNNLWIPITIGAISLALVITVLVMKGSLTDDQRYFFKILFAIGCAGVAAAIPGFINIKFKNVISAGGALAVFIFVFSSNPVIGSQRFNFTIYLKDSTTGQVINQPDLKVSIQLGGDRAAGEWSANAEAYKFTNIPAEFKSAEVTLTIAAQKGWTLNNKRLSAQIKLDNDYRDIYLLRSCSISGVILKDKNSIEGENNVMVSIQSYPAYKTYTDSAGNFVLDVSGIPVAGPYTIVFQKEGKTMSYNLDCGMTVKQKLLNQ
ncbi:MAG: hypothetical protein QM802_19730 [Agriterribacter sp.]